MGNLDRIRQLAGITESVEKKSISTGKILKETSIKGIKLALVQEGQHIFIKESVNGSYEYIGGLKNKHRQYSYTNLSEAERNLTVLERAINEGSAWAGHGFKNEADNAEELADVAGQEMETDKAEVEAGTETQQEMPAEEPAMDDAPESGDEMPADVEGDGGDDEELGFMAGVDDEPSTEEMPTEEPAMDNAGSEEQAPEGEANEDVMTLSELAGHTSNVSVEGLSDDEKYNSLAQIAGGLDKVIEGMGTEQQTKAVEKFEKMLGKYKQQEEGKEMKPFEKLTESELEGFLKKYNILEKYSIMDKPSIKYKITKLAEKKERAALLEAKLIEKKKINESKKRK